MVSVAPVRTVMAKLWAASGKKKPLGRVTAPVYVPAAVGVPERTPVVASTESPGGSAPELTRNVLRSRPETAKEWVYGLPTTAPGGAALVYLGGVAPSSPELLSPQQMTL